MERETKEIVTPVSNQKVVIKEWLTGRERRAIRSVFLKDMDISLSELEGAEGAENITRGSNVKANVLEEAENAAIENIVVSVDDKTENVLDTILDMREEDFDFVIKQINAIRESEEDEETKKK